MKNLLLFVLLFSAIQLSAQNTTVIFSTDEPVTLRINEPIDGKFNPCFNTNTLNLLPNISISYKIDIKDFGFVRCEYSNGRRCILLLEQGNVLEVNLKNNQISFKGDNATGNQYYEDNYTNKGLGFHYQMVYRIFKENIDKNIDLKKIDKLISDSCYAFQNDLKQKNKDGKITDTFTQIMLQNLYCGLNDLLFEAYRSVLHNDFNDYKSTQSDSIVFLDRIKQLIANPPGKEEVVKYHYFSTEEHCRYLYNRLNPEEKEKLLAKYDVAVFGKNIAIFLAPGYMHDKLLSGVLANMIQYHPNEFNYSLYNYFVDTYPDSEYTKIFQAWVSKQKKEISVDNRQTIIIDGSNINSLQELLLLDGIKGDYVYIDLWDTSCAPCKKEFQYGDDLHELINQYNNVVTVYLSIDNADKDSLWRKDIERYQLRGFNLRVSKSLYKDISDRFYQGNAIYIPRYLLIDPQGNVVNDNLPRPSVLNKLKEVFDNVLK